MRCKGCKDAYYCSSGCQEAHWSVHKLTCKDSRVLQEEGHRVATTDLATYLSYRVSLRDGVRIPNVCLRRDDELYVVPSGMKLIVDCTVIFTKSITRPGIPQLSNHEYLYATCGQPIAYSEPVAAFYNPIRHRLVIIDIVSDGVLDILELPKLNKFAFIKKETGKIMWSLS